MNMTLERHRQRLQRRMMASAAVFTVFSITAAIAGVRGTTRQDAVLLSLVLLFGASFVLLPRNAVPTRWPEPESPEAADRLEMMRDTLITLQNRSTYQRLFYFAIALLLGVVLPLMGI